MQKFQIDLKGREYATPSTFSVALQSTQVLCSSAVAVTSNGPSYGAKSINI